MTVAHTGFVGNSGVQNHSAGTGFPFTLMIVENASCGFGHIDVIYGGITWSSYDYLVSSDESFKIAHKKAENSALFWSEWLKEATTTTFQKTVHEIRQFAA